MIQHLIYQRVVAERWSWRTPVGKSLPHRIHLFQIRLF